MNNTCSIRRRIRDNKSFNIQKTPTSPFIQPRTRAPTYAHTHTRFFTWVPVFKIQNTHFIITVSTFFLRLHFLCMEKMLFLHCSNHVFALSPTQELVILGYLPVVFGDLGGGQPCDNSFAQGRQSFDSCNGGRWSRQITSCPPGSRSSVCLCPSH